MEKEIKEHPRTKLSLMNIVRLGFYPKGGREFMEGINYCLELGPIQSKINKQIGICYDFTKYLLILGVAARITYEVFK